MKKAFKCLISSILIFAMVVTTGISSKAAELKDGTVSQASVQTSEAELCGSNAKGGITTHSWKRWIATNSTWHFYSIYAVYEIPDKLKNAEWTISNKQIAKVVKTKNGMAIRTGKKTGTVVVQTKYRSESETVVYKINIQVVKALSAYKGKSVKAELVELDSDYMMVCYMLYNGTDKERRYNNNRKLKKYENGKWKTVAEKNITWTNWYDLPAHSRKYVTFNLGDHYDLSKLKKGTYRLYVGYGKKYITFKTK